MPTMFIKTGGTMEQSFHNSRTWLQKYFTYRREAKEKAVEKEKEERKEERKEETEQTEEDQAWRE